MPVTARIRKRDRYVAQACDRCKTAKVRCDGGLPCARCVSRNPPGCHYHTARFPMHAGASNNTADQGSVTALLERQADKLDKLLQRLGPQVENSEHVAERIANVNITEPSKSLPLLESPTSPFFCISVLDNNLHPDDEKKTNIQGPQCFSIFHGRVISGKFDQGSLRGSTESTSNSWRTTISPLDELTYQEVSSLLYEYRQMVDCLYPILDVTRLVHLARMIFGVPIAKNDSTLLDSPVVVEKGEIALLKIVVAITLPEESEEKNNLALRLHQSLEKEVGHMIWNTEIDLNGVTLLLLVSLNHLFKGKWRLALRMVDNIVRIILELGLNRCVVLNRSFPNQKDRNCAINAIHTTHVLNQHLSHALGFSTAARSLHLDLGFLEPIDAPYLKAMIEYAQIGASVCATFLGDASEETLTSGAWKESICFFEYRLEQWKQRIESRCFEFHGDEELIGETNDFLRNMFLLRVNHLQLIVSRSFLCTSFCNTAPENIWSTAVAVAADTIDKLCALYQSTKLYRFHEAQLDAFLISALGIILFSLTQDISTTSSPSSNGQSIAVPLDVFAIAQQSLLSTMDLLRRTAAHSNHVQRLWEFVRNLVNRLDSYAWLLPEPYPEVASNLVNNTDKAVATASASAPHINPCSGKKSKTRNQNICGSRDGLWFSDDSSFFTGEFGDLSAFFYGDFLSGVG